jgi:hypothetical protein
MIKMRVVFGAILAIALLGGSVVNAQHDGVIQDAVCRSVQLEAQAAVQAGSPYRNKGQLMKAATRVVDAAERAGIIDAACSSCILSQFARGVLIEDQSACGPDSVEPCDSSTCENPAPCPNPTGCVEGICVISTEGESFCIERATPCAELQPCSGTGDCPPGWTCALLPCCDRPVCVPIGARCPEDETKL